MEPKLPQLHRTAFPLTLTRFGRSLVLAFLLIQTSWYPLMERW